MSEPAFIVGAMTTLRLIDCSDYADLDTVIRDELASNQLPAEWAAYIRKLPYSDIVLEFLTYVVHEFGFYTDLHISIDGFDRCILLSYSPEEAEELGNDAIRMRALREGLITIAEELALVCRNNGHWTVTPFAYELWSRPLEEIQGRIATWLYELYLSGDYLDQVEENTGLTLR